MRHGRAFEGSRGAHRKTVVWTRAAHRLDGGGDPGLGAIRMLPYQLTLTTLDRAERPLETYRGQVLLIVNVASRCGFTPQYAGLEALHRRFVGQGFSVLGFPCNQFGRQEPGDDAQIAQFCSTSYDVSFPIFAKTDVNGAAAHPLYRFLTQARRGLLGTRAIKWNFTKFLVDRHGSVAARYSSRRTPESLTPDIERLLAG
jgi:glutathione peroxidase